MSGPKGGRIRTQVRTQLVDRTLELARQLERRRKQAADRLRGIVTAGRQGQSRGLLSSSDVETQLTEARRTCREARRAASSGEGSERLKELLDQMDQRREELTFLLKEEGGKLDQADSANRSFDAELGRAQSVAEDASRSESQLQDEFDRLNAASKKAVQAAEAAQGVSRQLQNGLEELRLWGDEIRRELSRGKKDDPQQGASSTKRPSEPAESAAELKARLAREAELKELRRHLETLKTEPEGGWSSVEAWLENPTSTDQCRGAVDAARRQLEAGDLESARASLEKADSVREDVLRRAEQNKQNVERNQAIAHSVMRALYDRDYSTPIFGDIQDNDPLSGTRIRADVPSKDGCGNIRVDIRLDGTTEFEVENVPDHELQICRDVLEGLQTALAKDGLELEMTDWGRASEVGAGREATRLRVRQNERQIEGEPR